MVAQVHGLGALQVRVARQPPVAVRFRELQEPRHQRGDEFPRALGARPDVQREIRRHLVVSGACRVQLAPHRPGQLRDAALDRHVDVLVGVLERELAGLELAGDGVQALLEVRRLFVGQHSRPPQA